MNDGQGTSGNLFAPIQATRLKSISKKAILDFLAERSQYEAAVDAQPGVKAISWSGCFDAIFLRSLICTRVVGSEIKEAKELTDKIIKDMLLQLSGTSKTVSFEEALADVQRNCRLDASEPDAKLRILMLHTRYIELCQRRGWKFYENAQKAAIKQIISVLEPPELKSRVRDAIKREKNYLEGEEIVFMEYLGEEAEICERFKPLRSNNTGGTKGKQKVSKEKLGSSSDSWKPSTKSKESLPPCLNKKCKEKHHIKDCPITSDTEKTKLLEEFKSKKSKSKEKDLKKEKKGAPAIDTNPTDIETIDVSTSPESKPHYRIQIGLITDRNTKKYRQYH